MAWFVYNFGPKILGAFQYDVRHLIVRSLKFATYEKFGWYLGGIAKLPNCKSKRYEHIYNNLIDSSLCESNPQLYSWMNGIMNRVITDPHCTRHTRYNACNTWYVAEYCATLCILYTHWFHTNILRILDSMCSTKMLCEYTSVILSPTPTQASHQTALCVR